MGVIKRTGVTIVSLLVVVGIVIAAVGIFKNNGSPVTSNAASTTTSTSSKTVETICEATQHKEACVSSLGNVKPGASFKDYLEAAVKATLEEVRKSLNVTHGVVIDKHNDPYNDKKGIEGCKDFLNQAIDQLEASVTEMLNSDIHTIQKKGQDFIAWLTGAHIYMETCIGELEKAEYKSAVEGGMATATKLTENALYIFSKIKELLGGVEITESFANFLDGNFSTDITSRRLLSAELDDSNIPTWVSNGDRKLLQWPLPQTDAPIISGPQNIVTNIINQGVGAIRAGINSITRPGGHHRGIAPVAAPTIPPADIAAAADVVVPPTIPAPAASVVPPTIPAPAVAVVPPTVPVPPPVVAVVPPTVAVPPPVVAVVPPTVPIPPPVVPAVPPTVVPPTIPPPVGAVVPPTIPPPVGAVVPPTIPPPVGAVVPPTIPPPVGAVFPPTIPPTVGAVVPPTTIPAPVGAVVPPTTIPAPVGAVVPPTTIPAPVGAVIPPPADVSVPPTTVLGAAAPAANSFVVPPTTTADLPTSVDAAAPRPVTVAPSFTPVNDVKPNVVVAQDGSGQFRTIMEAVNTVPLQNKDRFVIYIKAGVYNEIVLITKKHNVMIMGDGIGKTIITGNQCHTTGFKTSSSATVGVDSDYFIARGITFENTAGADGHQAVALRINGEKAIVFECEMRSYQDTLYYHKGNQFYKNCIISGTVDFIFGNGRAIIQDTLIIARLPGVAQANMLTADGGLTPVGQHGLVIQNCKIVAEPALMAVKDTVKTYLGRPWKEYALTMYLENDIDDFIAPAGYSIFTNVGPGSTNQVTSVYGEYMNTGPGANTNVRDKATFPNFKILTPEEADGYTIQKYIDGPTWLPATGVPFKVGL